MAIVISNASIKNNVATLIAHVHTHNSPVIEIIHYIVNVTSTEAEIFALQCGINQATQQFDINLIIVITDSIYTAKRIFDSLPHSYQASSAAISCELGKFFEYEKTKQFNFTLIFPCKLSWDFSKKNKCDNILNYWKILFQVSDLISHLLKQNYLLSGVD